MPRVAYQPSATETVDCNACADECVVEIAMFRGVGIGRVAHYRCPAGHRVAVVTHSAVRWIGLGVLLLATIALWAADIGGVV